MKLLTVQLPDDVYVRAEQRAAQRGATLTGEVAELVKRYSEAEEVAQGINGESALPSADVTELFTALDRGRNTTSVGPLQRDQLYDRPALP